MTANWQNLEEYKRLRGLDRAGLMWEWLRRDPDYIVWHRQASNATRGRSSGAINRDGELADWGLHFR